MIVSNVLFLGLSFIISTAACTTPPHICRSEARHFEYRQQLLNDYLQVWSGDLSLAESVFHPDVVLHADRFPSSSGKGSDLIRVTNRKQFVAFVQKARAGWKSYTFSPIKSTGDEDSVAVRWSMHGILGNNFTQFPTPLDPGSAVTYNGTDFLVFDRCTGQVRDAYIAQDLISYFHAMGLTAITV